MTAQALTFNNTASSIESNVLLLVCLLPLLVPFGLTRNIGLQAIVVSLTGLLAWISIGLRYQARSDALPRLVGVPITLYALLCIVSLVTHLSVETGFGEPLMRLGALELVGCVGIGLCLRQIPHKQLIRWLYVSIAALGIMSLPYSLHQAHHVVRIGGLLHQPDFLATTLAVGFLLGIKLWKNSTGRWRGIITVVQAYLLITIFMTQTRAVIALLFFILLLGLWLKPSSLRLKGLGTIAISAILVIGLFGMKQIASGRLTNSGFASESVSYRLVLQTYGVKAALRKPVLGYGANGVTQALACPTLHDAALQHTCHTGYYFDSSHNIYLDRFLELGWVGGLSFLAIILFALWYGFRVPRQSNVFAFCTLLIALYYLTNVSCLEIELLLWVALCHCFPLQKSHAKIAS